MIQVKNLLLLSVVFYSVATIIFGVLKVILFVSFITLVIPAMFLIVFFLKNRSVDEQNI